MRRDRLEKLAEHLETGVLGHAVFKFTVFNSVYGAKPESGDYCGTAGCAIGECPFVFPESWVFQSNARFCPVLVENKDVPDIVSPFTQVCRFFDIGTTAVYHLFAPLSQHTDLFGGSYLGCEASRYEVAANIRAFIAASENILFPEAAVHFTFAAGA